MDDLPHVPSWGPGRDGYREAAGHAAPAYEDRAAREVLKRLGRSRLAAAVAADVEAHTGERRLTFAALADHVPELPLELATARIYRVGRLALPDLYDRFATNPLVVAYKAARADRRAADPGFPFALVFPYTGDRVNPGPKGGTFMTLHDYEGGDHAVGTTRVRARLRLDGRAVTLTLETLRALLVAVGVTASADGDDDT